MPRILRLFSIIWGIAGMVCAGGCQMWRSPGYSQQQLQEQAVVVSEPVFVAGNDMEPVWERVVDVLHDYNFEIARQNKLDGVIETSYKVGASLAEPWHRDSVGFRNRLESTLQSIRRRVVVSITPANGGFLVSVVAYKELENLVGLAANSAGGATFQENTPLQRDLDVVVGQTTPSGWVSHGRDFALESDMTNRMKRAFAR